MVVPETTARQPLQGRRAEPASTSAAPTARPAAEPSAEPPRLASAPPCRAAWGGGSCDRAPRAHRSDGLCDGHRKQREQGRPLVQLRTYRPRTVATRVRSTAARVLTGHPVAARVLADLLEHGAEPYDRTAAADRLGLSDPRRVGKALTLLAGLQLVVALPRPVTRKTYAGHPVRTHTPYRVTLPEPGRVALQAVPTSRGNLEGASVTAAHSPAGTRAVVSTAAQGSPTRLALRDAPPSLRSVGLPPSLRSVAAEDEDGTPAPHVDPGGSERTAPTRSTHPARAGSDTGQNGSALRDEQAGHGNGNGNSAMMSGRQPLTPAAAAAHRNAPDSTPLRPAARPDRLPFARVRPRVADVEFEDLVDLPPTARADRVTA